MVRDRIKDLEQGIEWDNYCISQAQRTIARLLQDIKLLTDDRILKERTLERLRGQNENRSD